MPTNRSKQHPGLIQPWHARVTMYGVRYHLGYFSTYEEALAAENEFREINTHALTTA